LTSPPKVPAVQRKSLKQDRAASMPDAIWPVSRHRPDDHPRRFGIKPTNPISANDKIRRIKHRPLDEFEHRPIDLRALGLD